MKSRSPCEYQGSTGPERIRQETFTTLKYLVAPSAYKGSYTAPQIALAVRLGVARYEPGSEIVVAPIADGGDGTIEAIHAAIGGKLRQTEVEGPVGDPVMAKWLVLPKALVEPDNDELSFSLAEGKAIDEDLAIVELASACGLAYIQAHKLAPMTANSFGVGEVLKKCHERGYKNIVLAVGGSASTDGGMGLLCALGARFLNNRGVLLPPGGRYLFEISDIDLSGLSPFMNGLRLRIATDVVNPLLGENGAARVFAPQKGASPADVELLEQGLTRYANVFENTTGMIARNLQGAGAAGGVPFGCALALNAEIIAGFKWLTKLIGLEEKVKKADVVISAEGRLDKQSISGKATGELARICARHGKRFWVIAGQIEPGMNWEESGVERVISADDCKNGSNPGESKLASLTDISEAAYKICCSPGEKTLL